MSGKNIFETGGALNEDTDRSLAPDDIESAVYLITENLARYNAFVRAVLEHPETLSVVDTTKNTIPAPPRYSFVAAEKSTPTGALIRTPSGMEPVSDTSVLLNTTLPVPADVEIEEADLLKKHRVAVGKSSK